MAAAFADITNQMSVHDRKENVKSFNETHHKATKLRPPQLAIADLAALEASAMNPSSAGVPMSPLTSTSTAMTPTTMTSNSMMQSIAQRRGYGQGQHLVAPQGQIVTPTCAMELDAALSPIFPPSQTPTGMPMQSAWACPGAPLRPGHAGAYHTMTRCSTPMSGMSGPVVPLARTLSFSTNSTPSGTPMAGYRPLSGFPHPPLPSPLGFQTGIMRQFSFSQASTPLTPSPEGLAWGDVPSAPQKAVPMHNREGSMTPVPFSYQSPMW